jgi:hypothetical protein
MGPSIALAVDSGSWDFSSRTRCTDTRMVEKKQPPKRRPKYAVDDRRQFLTMMSPKIIKAVKLAALDRNEPAWVIMEEAVEEWLERHKAKRSV